MRWQLLLAVFIIGGIMQVSAAPTLIATNTGSRYPDLMIRDGTDIMTLKLIYNTDQCITNCYALINVTVHSNSRLFSSFYFIDDKNRGRSYDYNIYYEKNDSYDMSIPRYTEVCHPYTNISGYFSNCTNVYSGFDTVEKVTYDWKKYKGEVMPRGSYTFKIEAKKEPFLPVDWSFSLNGISNTQVAEYWAWWGSDWIYRYAANFSNLDHNQPYPSIKLENMTFNSANRSNELRLICDDTEVPVTVESNITNVTWATITTNSSWAVCYWYTGNTNPSVPSYPYRGGEYFNDSNVKFLTHLDADDIDVANNNLPTTVTATRVPGRFGQGYFCDGDNDVLKYKWIPSYNITGGTATSDDNFCVHWWMNHSTSTTSYTIFGQRSATTGAQDWWFNANTAAAGQIRMQSQATAGGYTSADSAAGYMLINGLVNYGICQNVTARSFWKNGTLINQGTREEIRNNMYNITICNPESLAEDLKAEVDEFVLFNNYKPASMNLGASHTLGPIEYKGGMIIVLNNPEDGYISESSSVLFNCTATDDVAVLNLTLLIDDTDVNTISKETPDQYLSMQTLRSVDNGIHNWTCRSTDGSGYLDPLTASVKAFTVTASTTSTSSTATCRYKKFGYYNEKLPWLRETGCI